MHFTVIKCIAIADLGTVAFFGADPIPFAFGSRHRVLVTRPDGESVEAVASVETVRSESSGVVFPAFLFASLSLRDLAVGSRMRVIGEDL